MPFLRCTVRVWCVCWLVTVAELAMGASVTLSPASLTFGNQVQGLPSSTKKVTLTNGLTKALTITSISNSLADYTQTNTCPISPATLAVGATCTISVTFTPSTLGSRPDTLHVNDTASGSPQNLSLNGTGIASVTATPTSLSYGNQVIGKKSNTKTVTVKNNLSSSLTITSITSNLSDYTDTTTCPLSPGTLAAGQTCTVSLYFTPSVAGTRSGTLTVAASGLASPAVSLTGTGVTAASVSPATVNFAGQALGTTSGAQIVTLTNNQSTALKITSITSNVSDFPESTSCPLSPSTLAGGASCTASVTFAPKATGSRSGTLTFVDNGSNSPQTVLLTGTGNAATLASIAVTPATSSVVAGLTQQFTATGTYTDGSTQNLTNSVTWTASAAGVATVGSGGLAVGKVQGVSSITAISGAISGSATLTVTPATLVSIGVTPASPSLALGTMQQMTAVATYSDGGTLDITTTVTWSTGNASVASISAGGLASSAGLGSTAVTASLGVVSGTTSLTTTPAALVSIAVTPAIPTIALGRSLQFSATGSYTDNSTQDITKTVIWSSGQPGFASISNVAGSQGLAIGLAIGPATITATVGTSSGSTTLTVGPAVLVSIALSPSAPSIAMGTTQQFTATGSYSDGSTQDLTIAAAWSSDTASVASVNNSGLATSVGTGTTNITASSGGVSSSSVLIVSAAQLVAITVTPSATSVAVGTNQQLLASGTYTDGTTQDLTAVGHWSSSDGTIANISNTPGSQGLASTLSPGFTTISLSLSGITGSATLNVTAASLVSISIAPQNAMIALGATQAFSAIGTYTDGTTQDLTSLAAWSSSDAAVAVVGSGAGSGGLATSAGPGTASLTATVGSVSASTTLTVSSAALVSIAVTPGNSFLAAGVSQQFSATGTYSDGSLQNLTNVATWGSSATAVVTIASSGLGTAKAQGASSITATVGSLKGSTTVTVLAATLVSIAITPTNPSLAVGLTQKFTATGTYSDNSVQELTAQVSWSSLQTGVAVISNVAGFAGQATGAGTGTTSISASLGSASASTALTVTAAALVSIAVTPVSSGITIGALESLTATGTYTDGSTQNLTATGNWSSGGPGVATVSNAPGSQGQVTGVSLGSTSIAATVGGISGTANVNVANAACVGPCVLTYHYDLARDGVTGSERTLTASNVNSATFGRVASITGLQGQIYAQPLYLSGMYSASSKGNVLLVATEADYVYAFDADTYQQIWGGPYLPAGEAAVPAGSGFDLTCGNITPSVGITGTPVIDPTPNAYPNPVIYFVTKSVDGAKIYHQRLHAVDTVTGAEVFGGPVEITTPVGSPLGFDPLIHNQRSGLVLTYDGSGNPQIYIAWASHCDSGAFHGWMMKYTVSAGLLNGLASNYLLTTQATGGEGGIWMGGGAAAADSSSNGNLFVATGNGSYDGVTNFAQSLLKLNSNLAVVDWYTPNDWNCRDGINGNSNCPADKDLGSGGVVLLNVPGGVPEAVAAGKDGEIYVTYQANLGHLDPLAPPLNFAPPANCTAGPFNPSLWPNDIAQCFGGIVAPLSGAAGSRATPAFWNNTLYTAGAGDALRSFPLSSTTVGTFNPSGAVATSPTSFAYPGSTAVVSWNGSDPGTGVVWTLQTNGWKSIPPSNAILRAFAAVPNAGTLTQLYQSTAGPGVVKFQVPTVANGKVFVGGQGFSGTGTEGQVYVYGLCPCN